jgi:hypothetical protein
VKAKGQIFSKLSRQKRQIVKEFAQTERQIIREILKSLHKLTQGKMRTDCICDEIVEWMRREHFLHESALANIVDWEGYQS